MAAGAKLSTSLIDGTFPDYSRVQPEPSKDDVSITCEKSALLRALRRMGVIEPGRVDMTVSGNLLVLKSEHPDIGEIQDEVEVRSQGEERIAAFNGGYLIDAVDAVPGDAVEIRFPSGRDAGVIRATDRKDYRCMIMGLKISKV